MDATEILRDVPRWLELVVLPIAGAVAQHVWVRYRRRLATLRWSVQYQPMAFATEDFGWGRVEILYDGAPTQNLHIANVQIQNASSRDLEQVRVNVVCNPGTVLLRSSGQVRGSLQLFPFAPDYQRFLERAAKKEITSDELVHWTSRSPFTVPVLNREQFADLRLLLSRTDYQTPVVNIAVEHLGVRTVHQPPAQVVFGVRIGQALVAGVLGGALVIVLATRSGLPLWAVALLAWVVGAVAQALGALVVRAGHQLLKMAD